MKHKLYDQAANCYTNANNKLKVTMAVAHARAKTAAELQAQSQAKDVDVKVAYQKAAILFLECHAESVKQNRSPEQRFYLATMGAAKCLSKGGKHSYAAQVFEKNLQVCSIIMHKYMYMFEKNLQVCSIIMHKYMYTSTVSSTGSRGLNFHFVMKKILLCFDDSEMKMGAVQSIAPTGFGRAVSKFKDRNIYETNVYRMLVVGAEGTKWAWGPDTVITGIIYSNNKWMLHDN